MSEFVISSSDVDLYAIWIDKDAHAIHYYNVYDAENTNPLSYLESKTVNISSLSREGYIFNGWYFNSSFSGSQVTGWNPGTYEDDISLYAKWTPIVYTISYNLNGGTLARSNPATYTVETDTITLREPAKTGYTFDGWFNGETQVTEIPKGSTGTISLNAQFTIITFPVNFYNDDGTALVKQIIVDYGNSFAMERSYYNVTGRQLIRWSTAVNGAGSPYLAGSTISSCTRDYTFYSYSTDNLNGIVTSAADLSNTLSKLQAGQTYDIIIADENPTQSTIGNALKNNRSKNVNLDLSYTNITNISNGLCRNCTNVIDLKLPSTVTSSDSSAFSGCTGLNDVYFGGSLEQWMNITFNGEYSTPMKYGKRLFIDGSELKDHLTIPSGITSVKAYTFAGVNNITSLTVPEGVSSIGEKAFSRCYITSLDLPENSLETIGFRAFEYNKLTTFIVPDSVTNLGKNFISDGTVKNLTLPAGVTTITDIFNYGWLSIENIVVPSTVTTIKGSAFSECANLRTLTFMDPNGWHVVTSGQSYYRNGQSVNFSNPAINANLFTALIYSYGDDGGISGMQWSSGSPKFSFMETLIKY